MRVPAAGERVQEVRLRAASEAVLRMEGRPRARLLAHFGPGHAAGGAGGRAGARPRARERG